MKKITQVPADPDLTEVQADPVPEVPVEPAEPAQMPMPHEGGSWVRMPDGSLKKEGED